MDNVTSQSHEAPVGSAANAPTSALLNGVRMVATLGHSCGLVDPYPRSSYSPMRAILLRLAEVDPWLVETWEYRQALARVSGGTDR